MKNHGPREWLKEIVAIPSVNPALAEDDALRGELRLVNWLEPWFAQRGFRTERIEKTPGRPNLLAKIGPERPRKTILFESHLDTVGVKGYAGNPFAMREENGRLYGRGTCDTKGPLAAFMAALDENIVRSLRGNGVELAWLGAIGEETGNLGAEEAVAAGLRADECIVLEPTELNIVHAHKGACWFKAATRGKAAHGSNPALGDNAILKMPVVWKAIEDATAAAAALHALPDLGRPTVSIGTIRGGSGTNVVPDYCEIQVDRRTMPSETCESILGELRQRLASVPGGVELHLLKEGPGFHTDAAAELPRRFGEALAAAGAPFAMESAAWCSDAGVLARACGQTIVWGPGSIAQAHTTDEYVELAQLENGADALRAFLGR